MAIRTRTLRALFGGLVALLLAQAVSLSSVVPARAAATSKKKSRSSPAAAHTGSSTSATREFDAARALLDAQNALPRIESHMAARRYEEAALLLDRTRGQVAEARERTSDRRIRGALDDVGKKTERLADKVEERRAEALAALPPGAALVGPPPPVAPDPPTELAAGTPAVPRRDGAGEAKGDEAREGDEDGDGDEESANDADPAGPGELPRPADENDPAYALPALDDTSIPVESHPLVDKWLDYFTGRGRPTFERWLVRSGRYMDSMKKILEKEGVPTDLVHLVFVESGFNPHARSVASAVGPWQFIRGTANLFGLKVNSWVDERKDPEASTVAAARYLKHLHGLFNSWPLALASYNAGEGAVGRAIKRQGTRDFWSLRLPEETRNYVPKFMAVLAISRDPSRYGFDQVAVDQPLDYDEVTIPGPVDLQALAEACATDVTQIRELNPQFLRSAAPAKGDVVTLRVPDGSGEKLMASLADGSLTLPRVSTPADPVVLRHKVRRGESLKAIALRYGVPASRIARANKIGKSSRLRVGRTLRIPQAEYVDGGSVASGSKARGSSKTRTVRVKKGQTLSEIAAVHGVSVAQLRRANGMSPRTSLKAGQRLKIPRAS
jgi:membrane-bound lytic murein transglycosylase D